MNQQFDLWCYEQGLEIVLTDARVDQIIREENGSHADGSRHEYEPVMTESGLVNKCMFCGQLEA